MTVWARASAEDVERAMDEAVESVTGRKPSPVAVSYPRTPALATKCRRLRKLGLAPKQIAHEVGRSVSTVRLHLGPTGQTRDVLAERRRRIAELWRDGMTHGEIARALGIMPDQVKGVINRLRAKGAILPRRRT